jgi:RimJ/RimL family protein N-acetyltransferase
MLVDPVNQPMRHAAAAAGFASEGVLRGHRLGADGRRTDSEVFARLSG